MHKFEEKIQELLLNEQFLDWLQNPNTGHNDYWNKWLQENSENEEIVKEAKHFIQNIKDSQINEKDYSEEVATMWQKINTNTSKSNVVKLISSSRKTLWYLPRVAIFIGIIFTSALIWRNIKSNSPSSIITNNNLTEKVTKRNNDSQNELVFLPDGSKVTLAQNAEITYQKLFTGDKREVSFSGEAFFEIAKNAKKPFYIHTKNIIVKVLGTSFKIIATDNGEQVLVKEGKVSVYLKGKNEEQNVSKILLAKQGCTYSNNTKQLVSQTFTPSNLELDLKPNIQNIYAFEDVSLSKVLESLEKMYSIPIHYNQDKFKNCFITISLSEESLEDKLKIITKTIDATFKINEEGIHISGKGCN